MNNTNQKISDTNQNKIRNFYNEVGIFIPKNPIDTIFTKDVEHLYSSLDYIYEYIHDYTEIIDNLELSRKPLNNSVNKPHHVNNADDAGSEDNDDYKTEIIALTNIKYACVGMSLIIGATESLYSKLMFNCIPPFTVLSLQKQYGVIRSACLNNSYSKTIIGLYELECMTDHMISQFGYNPSGMLNMLYEKNMKKLLKNR